MNMTSTSSGHQAYASIDEIFQRYFAELGSSVRPEQRAVIESLLAGNNTLSLMPTGGGKSLCYWIAGIALSGTTLVISPLTALMDEQADKLRTHGLAVAVLHSGIRTQLQFNDLVKLAQGALPHFVFVSPERLATDGFLEYVLRQQRNKVKLVVIDEIHCISQWGPDFRPFYAEIPRFLDNVFDNAQAWPLILGLTATLNRKDTEQICQEFRIDPTHVLKSQYLLRYAIQLNVIKVQDEPEKDLLFWQELNRHRNEKVLVYVDNRWSGERSTEEMSRRAQAEGFAAAYFHGSMSSEQKSDVIRRFKTGEVRMVFATSAFGMGIDIPDIRGVIHYRPPESVEQYYQQIGRVGRDGQPAWALLYYSDKNISFRKTHFIDRSFPNAEEIRNAFTALTAARGKIKTFNYFEEQDAQSPYHYLLRSEALSLRCKGIQSIDGLAKAPGVSLPRFDEYQRASRTGIAVRVAEQCHVSVEALMQDIYGWLAKRQIKPERTLQKSLFLEQKIDQLPESMIEASLADAAEKKLYRYGLLDDLAALLNGFTNSVTLHQQIGSYLGVDKFQLGRIHETVSGIMVRSKSEVIIANLLTQHRIPFVYEQRLEAGGYGFWPDFTIKLGGKTYYWEHLGRLDLEQYRENWTIKQRWYEQHFPGQLITTEESSTLSRSAEFIILRHLLNGSDDVTTPVNTGAAGGESINQRGGQLYHVRVLTEGPTDWKHLKAALTRLQQGGQFTNLEIEFKEDERDMGDKELLTTCRALSSVAQSALTICLFDRDVPTTLRQITEESKDYKYWGNSVYSVALPVPEHRHETPELCIEFYYRDEEIQRKDSQGRRLFIGTEFKGRSLAHLHEPLICADRNKAGKFTIVDSQVFPRDTEDNVALAKNAFAQYVLDQRPGFDSFDLNAFVLVFKLFEQLAQTYGDSIISEVAS